MQSFDINLFFELFSTNKQLLVFAFGSYMYISKRKLLALPDNTSFMLYGVEWIKTATQVKKAA